MTKRNLGIHERARAVQHLLGTMPDSAIADRLSAMGLRCDDGDVQRWRSSLGIAAARKHQRTLAYAEVSPVQASRWVSAYEELGNVDRVARMANAPREVVRRVLTERGAIRA
jgi:hypothetical protein